MVFLVGFLKENNTEQKIEKFFIGLDYQPWNMDPARTHDQWIESRRRFNHRHCTPIQ